MRLPFKFSKALLARFPEAFRRYFDTKWKQVTLMYNARGEGLIDIKKAFNMTAAGEAALTALVAEKAWAELNYDDAVYAIMGYVNRILSYTHDSQQFGKVEYWADAFTTWQSRQDDCDGYAVLIAVLCWLAGVPRYRLKVVAGNVELNNKLVGHAYCVYLKELDSRWYTVEGPYWAADARKRYRENVPHSEATNYKSFWWTTTDTISWAQHDLTINHGIGD